MSILILTSFILGFIADPIINIYFDPYSSLWFGSGDARPHYDIHDDEPYTWFEHFLKGFASLGLISFLKVIFANPLGWIRTSAFGGGTRRGGGTGRDRLANISWVVVLIGVLTFLWVCLC